MEQAFLYSHTTKKNTFSLYQEGLKKIFTKILFTSIILNYHM